MEEKYFVAKIQYDLPDENTGKIKKIREEKLSEHDNNIQISSSALGGIDKSVDLMKRLTDYLGK